jgi:hypothetical protein
LPNECVTGSGSKLKAHSEALYFRYPARESDKGNQGWDAIPSRRGSQRREPLASHPVTSFDVRFRALIADLARSKREVIVDPADTPKDLTAEQLSAADHLIYHDGHEKLDALSAEIRAIRVSVASREAGTSSLVLLMLFNDAN